MSDQFIGEIRCFGFTFAPRGWAFCNGQLIAISQNTALFSLLGTNYGGNGQTTFGLPNLQGAVPIDATGGQGPGLSPYALGELGGAEHITLGTSDTPNHTHLVTAQATDAGDNRVPSQRLNLAKSQSYTTTGLPQAQPNPTTIGFSGSSQPHNNFMPSLVLNFCIALEGVYPSRN
jgi:microcystin-dependent protein